MAVEVEAVIREIERMGRAGARWMERVEGGKRRWERRGTGAGAAQSR